MAPTATLVTPENKHFVVEHGIRGFQRVLLPYINL